MENSCISNKSASIIKGLQDHWSLGKMRLREFLYLFVESQDRVEFLNVITGGSFLYDVQQLLWDDLMMCVSRLTDPPQTSRHKNLAIKQLLQLPEVRRDKQLRCKLTKLVDTAVESAKPCHQYRNKRISHLDLKAHMEAEHTFPVKRASMVEVELALDGIWACLNAVKMKLLGYQLDNNAPIGHGRSKIFDINAQHLANAIKIADLMIDPSGQSDFKDTETAREFLTKIGLPTTWSNIGRIVRIRKFAMSFKPDQTARGTGQILWDHPVLVSEDN